MSSFIRIFELRSKILTFEKSQINLDFCSLNRIFAPMELKTVLINAAKIIFPVLLGGAILYWMYRGETFLPCHDPRNGLDMDASILPFWHPSTDVSRLAMETNAGALGRIA